MSGPIPLRRRRWPLVAIPIVVLLAAAGAAFAWLRPGATPAPALPADLFVVGSVDGKFADADHGFLVLGRCPADPCETWVGATDDGGRSWRGSIVPGLTFAPAEPDRITSPRVRLIVLDATHAVLESYYDAFEWEHPDHHRWYTSDGGRAWAEVPVAPVASVDELPPDAYAYTDTDPAIPQGIVLRGIRTDGTSVIAATEVSRPGLFLGRLVDAADDTLWLWAMNDSNLVMLLRSDDRGRSWADVPLPAGHPVDQHQYEFETADGTTAYLVDGTGFRLWRSSDSGTSWEELDVPFEAGGQPLRGRVVPDGRFVVLRPVPDGAGYRYEYLAITPTGSAFEPAEAGDFLLGDIPIVGQRVGENLEITDELGVRGPDGSWTPLPFPCNRGTCW